MDLSQLVSNLESALKDVEKDSKELQEAQKKISDISARLQMSTQQVNKLREQMDAQLDQKLNAVGVQTRRAGVTIR